MANQLNNLKIIHDMQKEGLINGLIGQVRQSKGLVESFAQKLSKRLKDIEAAAKPKEVEPAKIVAENRAQTFSNEKNQNNNFRKFDSKPENKFSQKPFNREQRPNDKKDAFAKKNHKGKTHNSTKAKTKNLETILFQQKQTISDRFLQTKLLKLTLKQSVTMQARLNCTKAFFWK